jgi:glycosyltransferase involved in cell wall biosynthesis
MKGRDGQTPLVSVIIPTYNRAHMIAPSLESALAQTLREYEIIVVDDGSTDTTRDFLHKAYGNQIRYIAHPANRGLSAARNTGIEHARGTYIAVLDDDDLWLPEKLALQVDLMKASPDMVLAYCGTMKVDCRGAQLEEIKPDMRGHLFAEMLNRNCLKGPASVAIFSREILGESGVFDTGLSSCADWDLWIRLARCGRIDFVDRPLVKYVMHQSNMHSNISGMARDTFAILDKYLPLLKQDNGSVYPGDRIYSNHLIHFAWEYYEQHNLQQFRDLLRQALERDPANRIPIRGDGLPEKEAEVMDVLREHWCNAGTERKRRPRSSAFSDQYIQLAWEYYHQGDRENFRRCVVLACSHAFPCMPLRLAIPFVKSYMGKGIAEWLHQARKRVRHAGN